MRFGRGFRNYMYILCNSHIVISLVSVFLNQFSPNFMQVLEVAIPWMSLHFSFLTPRPSSQWWSSSQWWCLRKSYHFSSVVFTQLSYKCWGRSYLERYHIAALLCQGQACYSSIYQNLVVRGIVLFTMSSLCCIELMSDFHMSCVKKCVWILLYHQFWWKASGFRWMDVELDVLYIRIRLADTVI